MTILSTTTAEADARLVRKDKDCSKAGFTLVRAWPHLDPTTADTLSTTLDAVATYTDPKADNETYSGTFVNSKVVAETGDAETSERHVTILQTLILVTSPADTAALAALAGVITQGNLLKDLFGKPVAGSDSTIGEEDTISYRWHNINTGSRATLMAITDANLVSGLPGAGWSYVNREFKEEDDNTATFTVVFQKITWNTSFAAGSPDLTWSDNYGTPHQRNNHLWLKVGNAVDYSGVYTATSGYNVMRVDVTERRDGAINIQRQEWKEAVGSLGAEIEEKIQRLINPFATANGTLYRVTAVNHNLLSKATAYKTLSSANATFLTAGYKQVETFNEVFNKDTGLWDSYAVWENMVWTGDVANSPDVVEWFDCGTTSADNDEAAAKGSSRTGWRATWHGIPNASAATMVVTLRDQAPQNAGFTTIEAGVRDNQNGSCTLWKVERRQVDAKTGLPSQDETDLVNTNPLGFENGAINFIRTVFDNFNYTALAAAVSGESAPATYTLLKSEESNHGNGLFGKVFTYIKATWDNTSGSTPNKVIGDRVIYGYDGYSAQEFPAWVTSTSYVAGDKVAKDNVLYVCAIAHTSGTFATDVAAGNFEAWTAKVRKTDGGDGIPIGDVEEIRDNEAEDTNHVITSIGIREEEHGSASLKKTQVLLSGQSAYFKRRYQPNTVGQNEEEMIAWVNLQASDCAAMAANWVSNEDAMASATPAAPASHVLKYYDRMPNGDGTYDLIRVTHIPRGDVTANDWDAYAKSHVWYTVKFRRIWDTATKTFKDQFRKFTWTAYEIQDSSVGCATRSFQWMNGTFNGKGGFTDLSGQTPAATVVKADRKFFGLGRYWALCVACTVTAWTTESDYAGDLGSIA